MALGDSMRAAQWAKTRRSGLLLRAYLKIGYCHSRLYGASQCGNTQHLNRRTEAQASTERERAKKKKKKKRSKLCELAALFISGCYPACGVLTHLQYVVHPATLQQSDTP